MSLPLTAVFLGPALTNTYGDDVSETLAAVIEEEPAVDGCAGTGAPAATLSAPRRSLASIVCLSYSLPMEERTPIPPGTLYMLVLKTLYRCGPMHGYGIAQHIQRTTGDILHVEEGSLYPALQRMLVRGWVAGEWKQSENNRRARFYHLTPKGRRQLTAEIAEFDKVIDAIHRLIHAT